MHRRGQIDSRQREAADRFRHAVMVCQGSVPSDLDMTKVSGGRIATPSHTQLQAGCLVSEATKILGRIDVTLITMIACEGRTIAGAALRLFGGTTTSRRDVEHCGHRLRMALAELAARWFGNEHRGERYVETGRVVHSTQRKTFDI